MSSLLVLSALWRSVCSSRGGLPYIIKSANVTVLVGDWL